MTKTPCPAFFIYLTKHSTFLQQRRRQPGSGVQQAAPEWGGLVHLQAEFFAGFQVILEISRQLDRQLLIIQDCHGFVIEGETADVKVGCADGTNLGVDVDRLAVEISLVVQIDLCSRAHNICQIGERGAVSQLEYLYRAWTP